jgi:hypothetical protein
MLVPGDASVPSTAWTRLPSASLASTEGIRIVETPAYRDCQTLSKPVHVAFAWKSNVRQLEPGNRDR